MAIAPTLEGLRALVIDDNEDATECVAWVFADAGAKVQVANDATCVTELIQDFDPQLVLLDLSLPEVDGYEACRIIRQLKGAAPFIVAVTGWGGVEDRERCLRGGFDLHLAKPVGGDAFIELGRLALRRSLPGCKQPVPGSPQAG